MKIIAKSIQQAITMLANSAKKGVTKDRMKKNVDDVNDEDPPAMKRTCETNNKNKGKKRKTDVNNGAPLGSNNNDQDMAPSHAEGCQNNCKINAEDMK